MNNERTEQTLSGEKCAFIVGDSVLKNVNGYEISGKLELYKFNVRPCQTIRNHQMPESSCKTAYTGKSRWDYFSHWNKRSITWKRE